MTTPELDFDRRYFDPAALARALSAGAASAPKYLYAEESVLAVNLARATGRPLFVKGPPGTGKSTLASSAARLLGWRYIEQVVTSRTRAQDLLWQFDAVRRLSDAQLRDADLPPRSDYVLPRALWKAADPLSAQRYPTPRGTLTEAVPAACVVLIDEIDKAEPDVPNDLLEVLERARFTVDDLDEPLTVCGDRDRLLTVITSNGERDMPAAFLRRCVVLSLPDPDVDWLVRVAAEHFGPDSGSLHRRVAELTQAVALAPGRETGARRPGTAEYLDAVIACRALGIDAREGNAAWRQLEAIVLRKAPAPGRPGSLT